MRFAPKVIILFFAYSFSLMGYGNSGIGLTPHDPFSKKTGQAGSLQISNDVASYDINQLQVLGSLEISKHIYAVISDPNGRTYKLQQGDKLDHGKIQIIQINSQGLEVKKLDDEPRAWSWMIPFPSIRS